LIRKTTVHREKVLCLIEGLNIYKKFSKILINTSKFKDFDPNASFIQPEKYGYAPRYFKLNINDKTLEVKNLKVKITGKHKSIEYIENKIPIKDIRGIMLETSSKSLLKKFTKDNKNTAVNSNIPFTLIFEGGKLELLSYNYNSFISFQIALNEVDKHKKNLKFD